MSEKTGKPIIGIVPSRARITDGAFTGSFRVQATAAYADAVVKSGGIPVMLPFTEYAEIVDAQVELVNGVILCGGGDIDAHLYGEEPHGKQGHFDRGLDLFYIHAVQAARRQNKPLLGICRGIQALNVAYGGTLIQDIQSEVPDANLHSQHADAAAPCHYILVENEGFFKGLYPERAEVNSFHHQAVKTLGEGLAVRARSTDGIIEAVEGTCADGKTPVVGVQWHPEMMAEGGDEQSLKLFQKFVSVC